MVRRLFFVLLISSVFLLLGCEGPAGPVGPQGPQGPQVEQGKPGSQDPESQPVSPPATNLVEELVVLNKADCLREASQSSYVDAIRLRTIEAADPDRLTDEERSAWNQFFMNTNSELRSSCIAYWSEAVTVENADKRNALVGDRPNDEDLSESSVLDGNRQEIDWYGYWRRAQGWAEEQLGPQEYRELRKADEEEASKDRLDAYFFGKSWRDVLQTAHKRLVNVDRAWLDKSRGSDIEAVLNYPASSD